MGRLLSRKPHYLMTRSLEDRDHLILECSWRGTLSWTSSTQNFMCTAIQPSNLALNLSDTALFNDGKAYTTSSAASTGIPELSSMFTAYGGAYVYATDVTFIIGREDHGDDYVTQVLLWPASQLQQSQYAGTFPNQLPPGSTGQLKYAWLKRSQPYLKYATMSSVGASRQVVTLHSKMAHKKMMPPGFPTASSGYWNLTTTPGGTITGPGAGGNCYWNMALFNDGVSDNDIMDIQIKVKYYCTFFGRYPPDYTLFEKEMAKSGAFTKTSETKLPMPSETPTPKPKSESKFKYVKS